jgi:hypothetical protein
VGLFKKIWAGVKDVAKAVSYVVAAPVNSITGHEYNPDYETKFGNAVGKTIENSVDNQHTLFKSWADRFTFGYASKLANVFRDKEEYESTGNYLENSRDYGYKWLDKLNDFTSLLGGSGRSSSDQSGQNENVDGITATISRYSGIIKLFGVFVGLYLLLSLLFKK